MSGPLELYRTTVNLRGLGSGAEIEIDPTDPGWAGDIAAKRVVRVRSLDDPEIVHEPWADQFTTGSDLPEVTVTVHPADGSEPYEVEGVVEQFSSNGEGDDGARWPPAASRHGIQGDWSGS